MFARLSQVPTFLDERSDSVFGNIGGSNFDGDVTMVATLRSLLYPRIDKNTDFVFRHKCFSAIDYITVNTKDIFNNIGIGCNQIIFVGINGTADEIVNIFSKFDDVNTGVIPVFKEEYPSIQELIDLKLYFKAKIDVECRFYIIPDNNFCICFYNSSAVNTRYHHLFVALIPRYIPSLFINNPITEDEDAVCESLTGKSSAKYIECMNKLAKNIDVRSILIEQFIKGFEKRIKETQLRSAQETLNTIESLIESNARKYLELIRNREEAIIKIEGLNALKEKASDNSELAQYLKSNKNIEITKVEDPYIHIIVSTHLSTFDVEAFTSFKRDGSIYREYYYGDNIVFHDVENRKIFMNNIFNEDPLLKIKMCAYFMLDVRGTVKVVRGYSYPDEYKDFVPNPHLQRHACLNSNKPLIEEQLRNGEIIGAIECCMASAKAVNVLETSQTFRPMMEEVFKSKNKIITNSDGVDMTPVEALEWVKAKLNA